MVVSHGAAGYLEMPPPEEQPLLQQILRQPTITYATPDWVERLRQHPTSRYLAWSRLGDFGSKLYSGVLLPDPEAEKRRRLDVVAEILVQEWGQFEEEALDLACAGARTGGQPEQVAEIIARLRAKFPDSETVRRFDLAREDERAPDRPPGVEKR